MAKSLKRASDEETGSLGNKFIKCDEGRVLMWFRNDLRVHDNPALFHASEYAKKSGIPVIAVYAYAPEEWESHDLALVKLDFMKRTLQILETKLQKYGIPLNTILVPKGSRTSTVIADYAQAEGVKAVFYNVEYEVDERKRDEEFQKLAAKHGILTMFFDDQCVVPPGTVLNQAGSMSKVFTPFKKAWIRHIVENGGFEISPEPHHQRPVKKAKADAFPEIAIEPSLRKNAEVEWPAGEDAALERVELFLKQHSQDYKEQRDFPYKPATSRISAYLAIGSLSIRACLQAALDANKGKYDTGLEGAVHWISELCWREFYRNILVHFPQVCRGQPFQPLTNQVAWRGRVPGEDAQAEADFEAWKQGRTGYPLVDAAMRCLLATGWMHNRLRMVSAMFLTKDLLIWWPRGESFFMRHLIDGDFCSNNGGWQWSASTGTDSQPYFRIFNPLLQSEKFDAKGEFIRKWVPELKGLDNKAVHAPFEKLPREHFEKLGYPRPVVDHNQARKRCLDAFMKIMKKP